MFSLDGKVAVVTGASRGIGAAIARALAQAGAHVVVNHLHQHEEAETVCQAVRLTGRRAVAADADVRAEDEVRRMFKMVDAEFGPVDILVNNAGQVFAEDIFSTSLATWDDTLATHLTGTFLCAREAMHRMCSAGRGRVIQISSVVAHQGALKGYVHYAAAKSGLLGFTRTLARTAAPYGVTANAIAPGIIATEMLYACHGEDGVRKLAESAPLGLGRVEDVGAAAVFLASDEARYITGAILDINGGLYFH